MNPPRPHTGLVPILLSLLYDISPIDLIPDSVPFIGVLDDAIIVLAPIIMGIMQLRKSRKPAQVIMHQPSTRH